MSLLLEALAATYEVIVIVMWAIFYTFVSRPRKSVRGERVLITGAGSGIGRLLALRFAREGATVVLWDITEHGNAETLRLIHNEGGGRAYSYICDVSERDEVYRVAKLVTEEVGRVTMLVNNAGIVTGKPFLDCTDDEVMRTINVNLMAHCWTIKAFLPQMVAMNRGHIVSIASIAGILGCPGLVDYCVSKHGSVGLAKTLDLELTARGATGVHVTTVCPHFTNTGMFEGCVTRFPWLLPMLSPETVADRSMQAILTNRKLVYIPRVLYLLDLSTSILPVEATTIGADFVGTTRLMDTFIGRQKQK